MLAKSGFRYEMPPLDIFGTLIIVRLYFRTLILDPEHILNTACFRKKKAVENSNLQNGPFLNNLSLITQLKI